MHRAKARKLENGEPFEMNDGDVRCWGKDLPDDDSTKIFRDLSLSYLIVCLRIEMKNVDSRGKKSCQKIHSMQIFPDSHPMTFRDWSLTLCRLLGNQKVSTEYFVYATRWLCRCKVWRKIFQKRTIVNTLSIDRIVRLGENTVYSNKKTIASTSRITKSKSLYLLLEWLKKLNVQNP